MAETSKTETLEHLNGLIKQFENVMLVSITHKGHLHARPMAVAEIDDAQNMWFFTVSECLKTAEIAQHHDVCLTMQKDNTFISLTGRALKICDCHLVNSLWKDSMTAWFPQGKETPNLALLKVETRWAEYWDYSGIGKNLRWTVEAMTSVIAGEEKRPYEQYGDHAKVSLTTSPKTSESIH